MFLRPCAVWMKVGPRDGSIQSAHVDRGWVSTRTRQAGTWSVAGAGRHGCGQPAAPRSIDPRAGRRSIGRICTWHICCPARKCERVGRTGPRPPSNKNSSIEPTTSQQQQPVRTRPSSISSSLVRASPRRPVAVAFVPLVAGPWRWANSIQHQVGAFMMQSRVGSVDRKWGLDWMGTDEIRM